MAAQHHDATLNEDGPYTTPLDSTTIDAQIAAVCRQYDSVLATRNTTDFTDTGIQLVNPWDPTI